MKNSLARKISFTAMLALIALGLSYVEGLLPPLAVFPGIKLGLANIAVIFTLYKLGFKSALSVSLIRVLLTFLLFGSVISFAYSFSGAFLSLHVMYFMKKSGKFSEIGVSILGAITHNTAQILVAILIFSIAEIAYYLPFLIISAVISGIFIGIISALIVRKIKLP